MDLLIKKAAIITMTEEGFINEGYVGIEKDRIVYVGAEEPQGIAPARIIDGRNRLVIPGLVNSHTHIPMILLRSYADDIPLKEWLFDKMFPIEDKFIGKDIYWASQLAMLEMTSSGTTSFADMYMFMDKMASAVEKSGMRAHLSRGLQCFDEDFNPSEVKQDRRVSEAISLFETYNDSLDGRIKVGIAPHSVYACTPNYLKGIVEVANGLGAVIHTHLSETFSEVEECKKRYGRTPVEHLEYLGLLDLPLVAAHCVHLSERDIRILKDKKVNVAYNPGSNLKLGSGIAPIKRLFEEGINISLGSDGPASNNNLNMLEEIYLAAVINKGVENNPTLVKAFDALKMATINGAKALGFEDTGMIKEGMKADLVIIDIDKPHFYPRHNIISNLVYSGQGNDVEKVIVDGKILMEKGEFKTIDFEEVKFHINKICQRIFL
jgi:5-methylthioadenosine/S-adenosylhomocysteine deaminase